jgi:quercetin dioxygenase-like cupin family protein
MNVDQEINRQPLLDARFTLPATVERVHTARVELPAGLRAGAHTHPCHVVGQILTGEVDFQIDGGPLQRLVAGDAFHEPSHVRILRFDNPSDSEPAVFIANYLLAPGEDRLIDAIG